MQGPGCEDLGRTPSASFVEHSSYALAFYAYGDYARMNRGKLVLVASVIPYELVHSRAKKRLPAGHMVCHVVAEDRSWIDARLSVVRCSQLV